MAATLMVKLATQIQMSKAREELERLQLEEELKIAEASLVSAKQGSMYSYIKKWYYKTDNNHGSWFLLLMRLTVFRYYLLWCHFLARHIFIHFK